MIWASHICSRTLALALAVAACTSAGTLTGHVELVSSHDGNVRKHADNSGAVVWLEPLASTPVIPAKAGRAQMVQKNKTFSPHVLAVSVGTVVDFPNFDPIFHNAFSNYNGQIFDIGLYPPGTNRSQTFRREGVVRVFCNIHPSMSAVIVVLKTPYFATSAKNGGFELDRVPSGAYRLHVFYERATEQTLDALARTVEISEAAADPLTLQISESGYLELPHKNKFGKDYPPAADSTGYSGNKP